MVGEVEGGSGGRGRGSEWWMGVEGGSGGWE